MPDALAVLAEDHRQVLEMLNELTGGPGEPAGDPRERKAVAERLAIAESKHEAIEEACFWPVVRDRLENGDELAKQALEQETSGKELIHDLDHISSGSSEFSTLVHRLSSAVRDHINFEESQVWPKLRLALTDAELDDLGKRLEAARRTAPTRPHPKTPPDPRLLGTLGPAVGVVDRARDVLTGRGQGTQGAGRWRMVASGLAVGAPLVALVAWSLLRARRKRRQAGEGEAAAGALLGAGKVLAGAKAAKSVAPKAGKLFAGAKAAKAVAPKAGKAAKAVAPKAAKLAAGAKAAKVVAPKAGKLFAGAKAAKVVAPKAAKAVAPKAGKLLAGAKAAGSAVHSPALLGAGAAALHRAGSDLGESDDAGLLRHVGGQALRLAADRVASTGEEHRSEEHADGDHGLLDLAGKAVAASGASAVAHRIVDAIAD
jgi:hemerythrin-like domain-containing protein